MIGWIKLHRTINKHWIFKDADKLKAWITILLNVNHEENKVNLGNDMFICGRGESLKSLDTWSKLFGNNWNKSKVRRFFDLLKNDSMIVLKNEHKTTRLTVCNYDNYQDLRNTGETQVKRKRNAGETQVTSNKNDKKIKNDKEKKSALDLVFLDFEEMRNKLKKPLTEKAKNLLLKKLNTLSNNEETQILILEQSIMNSWQGIFELKNNNQNSASYNQLEEQAKRTDAKFKNK